MTLIHLQVNELENGISSLVTSVLVSSFSQQINRQIRS